MSLQISMIEEGIDNILHTIKPEIEQKQRTDECQEAHLDSTVKGIDDRYKKRGD